MHRFANPARFLRLARALQPWLLAVTLPCLVAGLYYGLFNSPIDYQQKDTVRIMYVHVPAAWTAMFGYAMLAVASAIGLIWKHPLADLAGKAVAPIGAGFTAIALATGSLWGKPTWGTWWVWDARLTSVVVLLFLYLGYIAIWNAFEQPQRAAKAAAVLALVGIVNLPIIKFSVDWWNTLHQPASITRMGASAIDPAMLTPLLLMAGAYMGLFLLLFLLRMRVELAERRVAALQLARSRAGEAR
ncbi:MAG: heme ABC transporter permease [Alphaproteobacteria bacterium]|nr:heme ABC transporter permease [Alphaproteobacteria bacterium]MCB9930663.1 heme ABC transporter permease [Alphaproteobacteria bacterium]